MKILRGGASLHPLSTLFNEGVAGAVTDGQLLERFSTRPGDGSEQAFAAIVERHGPVVLRLCRSILRDEHEAYDAFQATFLVLARRARSLWVRDSLGPWLHAVAFRVASCARAAAIRRRRHERRHARLAGGRLAVYEDEDRPDLEAVIHEEIGRLPEHYRAALVLCDLQGCTHEQAARHLGLPVGTVKSRQARGRERLRIRLIRRGLSPSSGPVLGAALAHVPVVPTILTRATAKLAAIRLGPDSTRVLALTQEVLKIMFLHELKRTVVAFLVVAAAGGLVWRTRAAPPSGSPSIAAAIAQDQAAAARRQPSGKIYTTVENRDPRGSGAVITSLIAVSPQTGQRDTVVDRCGMRPRIAPDGRSVALVLNEALWIRGLDRNAEARQILAVGDQTSGSPPVWSPDGKQIIISLMHRDEPRWVYKTLRVDVDGSGRDELAIPPEDGVHDWSSDGRWLLTASQRGAKIGWQLYVMTPDGTDQRRITESGNPFYARFSPDSRRLLYSDNAHGQQSGIWVVDADGKNGRLVFPVDSRTLASACWAPDGTRIAIILHAIPRTGVTSPAQLIVMDLDGGHRTEIEVPGAGMADMPDWR